jgi:polyferredoxin
VDDQKEMVTAAAANLSAQDRAELARQLAPPEPATRNTLWLIVISAISLVVVGSFITLAVAVFVARPEKTYVTPELILTMFTSAIGFLAGLFVPSPAGK